MYLTANGQTTNYKFSALTTDHGLSQLVVESIIQDTDGFLWIGTQNGINRYDGKSFKVYLQNPTDTTSISDDYVRKVYQDSKGRIWAATYGGGLNLFNNVSETFTHFKHEPDDSTSISSNDVRIVFEDSQKKLWIGTNNGLDLFHEKNKSFEHFSLINSDYPGEVNNKIRTILEDSRGLFWIGTYGGGLFLLDKENLKFKQFVHRENDPNSISHNNVWYVYEDSNSDIWVCTYGGGLNKISVQFSNNLENVKLQFTHFLHSDKDANSISSNKIVSCLEDRDGFFWVGTDSEGLNLFDRKTNRFQTILMDEANPYSLNNNSTWTLFEDNSGLIWIGTWGGGLNKLDKRKSIFNEITPHDGLSGAIVMAIAEGQKENYWVGTYGGGLHLFNSKLKKIKSYLHEIGNSNSLSDNNITSLLIDENKVWIGTDGSGLDLLDTKNNSFTHFYHSNNHNSSLPNDFIKTIYKDRKGNIWIGTLEGVSIFDKVKKTFTTKSHNPSDDRSLSHNAVRFIYHDSKDNIWIGTFGGGLNRYIPEEELFIHYRFDKNDSTSISSDKLRTMYEDRNGALWIGTDGGGLCKFDPVEKSFKTFLGEGGFANYSVLGIVEDDQNNLWFSSGGIVKFNLKNKQSKYYNKTDGLLSNEFTPGSVIKDSRGRLFFGTVEGVQFFNPKKITDREFTPPLVVTNIRIKNEKKNVKEILSGNKEIKVDYLDSFINLEFASLDFTNPEKIHYRYRLLPEFNSWIDLGNESSINFASLQPGNYLLEVAATNGDGVWNSKPETISIIVTPPFYRTFWFYSLIILFAASVVYFFHHITIKKRMEMQRLRLKLASDLHDDVGSSLTQISLNADFINYEENIESIKKRSILIRDKSVRLIDSLNDVIWSIDSRNDFLYDLADRIHNSAAGIISESGIVLSFDRDIENERRKLLADFKQNVFLIAKEAVNNAVKYSKAKNLKIYLEEKGGNFKMEISDDGIGIKGLGGSFVPEKGNGLKNMKLRSKIVKGDIQFYNSNGLTIVFTKKL